MIRGEKTGPRPESFPPYAAGGVIGEGLAGALWEREQRERLTRETPPRAIGDKAYDSDQLDQDLAERGVELIAPHCTSRKNENVTQDRRPLQRYRRRWTVERSIAWIQNFRRLCIRWEKSSKLFRGFLHLGRTLLLLRHVVG